MRGRKVTSVILVALSAILLLLFFLLTSQDNRTSNQEHEPVTNDEILEELHILNRQFSGNRGELLNIKAAVEELREDKVSLANQNKEYEGLIEKQRFEQQRLLDLQKDLSLKQQPNKDDKQQQRTRTSHK